MAWIQSAVLLFSLMSISAYRYIDPHNAYRSHQRRLLSEPSRMSERSIQSSDQNQRIQSRSSTRTEEIARSENGTFKILNKPVSYNRRHDTPSIDKVVFPGLSSRSSISPYVPEIPDSCKRIGICTDIPNYPTEEVDALIDEVKGTVEFQYDKTSPTPDIAQRIAGERTENSFPLCSSRNEIINPKGGQSDNNDWYWIVNTEKNPIQGFKVEICDQAITGCANFVSFENGYTPKCLQKYIYRKMKVLSPDRKKMLEKSIKVPSCCSCVASLT